MAIEYFFEYFVHANNSFCKLLSEQFATDTFRKLCMNGGVSYKGSYSISCKTFCNAFLNFPILSE